MTTFGAFPCQVHDGPCPFFETNPSRHFEDIGPDFPREMLAGAIFRHGQDVEWTDHTTGLIAKGRLWCRHMVEWVGSLSLADPGSDVSYWEWDVWGEDGRAYSLDEHDLRKPGSRALADFEPKGIG